jgi:Ca-activated chloride channel family protein
VNFEYASYLPLIIIAILLFLIFGIKNNKNYFKWVEDHWFFKVKRKTVISSLLYFTAISILMMSLLDMRGKPKKFTAKIPKQKTIILIDTSLSMLAEDVRPNRLKKAIILARHFIKKAIGHQLSVLVFSDTHKKLVPFTTDIELIDSRIAGLNNLKIRKGGTNLSTVIMESLSYLKNENGIAEGNLVIFTDAEENEVPSQIKIPKSVSVAMIGVGTLNGASIPIRSGMGTFMGNKKFNGKDVITKLNETVLRDFGKKIKNYKYWIASTYSIPTEEIMLFLHTVHKSKHSDGEVVSKPVLGFWIVALACFLLCLSYLLKLGKHFVSAALILLICTNVHAKEKDTPEEEEKELTAIGKYYLNKYKVSSITDEEKLKLAEEYLKSQMPENSEIIYSEQLDWVNITSHIASYINHATTQVMNKEVKKGLLNYYKILSILKSVKSDASIKLQNIIRSNVLLVLTQQKQKQKQKKNKSDKDKKDNKNSSGEGESEKKDKKDKEESKDKKDSKSGDSKKDKKDKKDSDKEKNKDKDKDKDENENEGEGDEKKNNDKQKSKDKKNGKSKENGKKFEKKKLPSLLKQLINDDRILQGKKLDTTTHKQSRQKRKDW